MPHYVNIAWEDYFLVLSFCLQGQGGSLDFAFYLKNQSGNKKQKTMCRKREGQKA